MSSKVFTKKVFDWLHQVNRDKRVHKFDVAQTTSMKTSRMDGHGRVTRQSVIASTYRKNLSGVFDRAARRTRPLACSERPTRQGSLQPILDDIKTGHRDRF